MDISHPSTDVANPSTDISNPSIDVDVSNLPKDISPNPLKDTAANILKDVSLNPGEGKFPKLSDRSELTRGLVIQLIDLAKEKCHKSSIVCDWLKEIFKENSWEWPSDINEASVHSKILIAKSKLRTFSKGNPILLQKREKYLKEEFKLPNQKSPSKRVQSPSPPAPTEPSRKRRKSKYINGQRKEKNGEISKLESEIDVSAVQESEGTVETADQSIDASTVQGSDSDETAKTADKSIDDDYASLKQQIRNLQNQKRVQKSTYRSTIEKMKKSKADDIAERNAEIAKFHKTKDKLNAEIRNLQAENADLLARLEEVDNDCKILSTKKDGKTYTDEVKLAVYELSLISVSVENIPHAIRIVMDKLARVGVGPLPDPTTCRRIVRQMDQLEKVQEVPEESSSTT